MISKQLLSITKNVSSFVLKHNEAFAAYSDVLADARKTTGLTADEIERMSEDLKRVNTRTSQEELMGLVQIAGKLGVEGYNNILGFARAGDQLTVALGEDLGGSAEEATRQVGKIIDIFRLTEDYNAATFLMNVPNRISVSFRRSKPGKKCIFALKTQVIMSKEDSALDINLDDIRALIPVIEEHTVRRINNREHFEKSVIVPLAEKILYSLNCRMIQGIQAAVLLLEANMVQPASMLVRGALENCACLKWLNRILSDFFEKKDNNVSDLHEKLLRLLLGNRRQTENRDSFDEFIQSFKAVNICAQMDSLEKERNGVIDKYEKICEYVHTNYYGVAGCFSRTDETGAYTIFGPCEESGGNLYYALLDSLHSSVGLYIGSAE